MGTLMSIPYELDCVSLYNVEEINSSFATGTLKVMYLGSNRNGSYFSKDAVEKALPSLRNVPIVCRWDDQAGEIGGHDIAVVSDGDGGLRLKNLTEPCGVVPDHARFSFQIERDADDNEHEYLVIDGVILWKRQDVYRYIVNDLGGKVKHSMEVNVLRNGKTADGYYDITNFEFTALCLLGNCEPCFQGSELELYSAQNFKQKMEQMMLEMKECFSKVNASTEDDIHPQKYSTEGGERVLNESDVMTDAATISESEEFTEVNTQPEGTAAEPDLADGSGAPEISDDEAFALASNIRDELVRALEAETVTCEWGEMSRYWFMDYDADKGIVYGMDTLDGLVYGFAFEKNGDAFVISQDSKKRMKLEFVEFDEGEQQSLFAQKFAGMQATIKMATESNTELEAKYQVASDTIASMQNELETLRKFKSDTEAEKAKAAKDQIFAQFPDLVGIEAFDKLVEDRDKYDAVTLEEKCFALRGRKEAVKFSVEQQKTPKLRVEKSEVTVRPYGGIFEEYGYGSQK